MSNQMMGQMVRERPTKSNDLVITRIFDAPRELVWKYWTEPERVKTWWGPRTYTAPFAKIDARVGGKILMAMRPPEGKDVWSVGTYKEFVEPQRIVVTDSFADEKGNIVPGTEYGMGEDFPMEALITIGFEEKGGKTTMSMVHSGLPESTTKDAGQGWNESFDKLAEAIHDEIFVQMKTLVLVEPNQQAATIIRVQDAPRAMVFRAQTDPTLFPQFWGPEQYTTTVERMEARKGGIWRVIQRDKDGKEYAFNGVYHDVKDPEVIMDTWEWEGMPGHVVFETITFEEIEGKTKLTNVSVFQSVEDRDGMYKSGMVEGSEATMDRLATLLKKMRTG
jgi:uncharacterized protein YndB with AHSA1/START domain